MRRSFMSGFRSTWAFLDDVPSNPAERQARLSEWFRGEYALRGNKFSGRVTDPAVHFVEAFEISEHGARLTDDRRNLLFPFPHF